METGNQSNMSIVPTPDTCPEQLARTEAINCSSDVVYTQPTCQEFLLPLQSCLPDRLSSRDVYISATNQEAVEAQASELVSGLDLLGPSPECRAAVQPFLCLYLFGLCDSRGTATSPRSRNVYSSAQMCVNQSGLRQTAFSHCVDHLCQSAHASQVLHQPSVIIDCSTLFMDQIRMS